MFIRSCFAVALLSASVLSAATGTLKLKVRNVTTGFSVRASVKLEGPESLTLQTDDSGSLTRSLLTGEYREEVSAPGYKLLRSHTNIGPGSSSLETMMLDPLTPPEEERPDAIEAWVRPGFTLLHGYVEDDNSGKPLPGATVRVARGGAKAESDAKGHFYLSVPTPEPENPGGMGTDTVICEKTGYKTDVTQNVGITGEAMGPAGCALERGSGQIIHGGTHSQGMGVGEEPQSARPGETSLSPELQSGSGTPVRLLP